VSVWKNFHKDNMIEFIKLCIKVCELDQPDNMNFYRGDYNELPSMESIRRVRQKFQENGKFMPTDPKVAEDRKRNIPRVQKDLRDWQGND